MTEIGRQAGDREAIDEAVRAGHETDVVRSRVLWGSAVAIVSLIVVAVIAIYVIEPLFVARQERAYPPENPLAVSYGRMDPPAPRLQVDPALEIQDHRDEEEELLTSYGWVDQKKGIVHIPIDRAMELLLYRGLPDAAAPSTEPEAPAAGGAAARGGAP